MAVNENQTVVSGTYTLEQRVQIAQDVIDRLRSKQRKVKISTSVYIDSDSAGRCANFSGAVTSKKIGSCEVCAIGALFLAAVDRYNQVEVCAGQDLSDLCIDKTDDGLGPDQVSLIESAFEGWFKSDACDSCEDIARRWFMMIPGPKERLIAICENIVKNGGLFKPEQLGVDI